MALTLYVDTARWRAHHKQVQEQFPGLVPGDRWCVVAARWAEALEAGVAPPVVLEATHASVLEFVSMADLEAHTFAE